MTNQARRSRRKPNFWLRATPLQRAGVVAAALVLPCCGGAAAAGTMAGGDRPPVATAPAGPTPAPAAKRLAGERSPAPVVQRTITRRTVVPYPVRKVPDGTLARGVTRVRTPGATGVRTRTYAIVLRGGREISHTLVRSVVTERPVTKVVAVGTGRRCDPNYTPCVPVASDVDCAGGGGNGPAYVTGPVRVTGRDVYGLDRDGDGTACDG